MSFNRPVLTVFVPSLFSVLMMAWGPAALAQVPDPMTDPFCLSMPPDAARIASDWKHPAQKINIFARAEGDTDVPLDTKVKFTLFPSEKVVLPAKPELEGKVTGFSGLVSFRTGSAGGYRVSLNQYIWLEMMPHPSGPLADVLNSDKRMNNCTGMGKNLSFELAANTRYWLQMSGADKAETELLISAPK